MTSPSQIAHVLRVLASHTSSPDMRLSQAATEDIVKLVVDTVSSDDEAVRTAGIKEIWRQLFRSKGERKMLEKVDRMKNLKKVLPKLVSKVRSGEDLSVLAKDDGYADLFLRMFTGEPFAGSSDMVHYINEHVEGHVNDMQDVKQALDALDKFFEKDDHEDDEDEVRDMFVKRLSQLEDDLDASIKKAETKLEARAKEKKKGKKLDKGDESEDKSKGKDSDTPFGTPKRVKPKSKTDDYSGESEPKAPSQDSNPEIPDLDQPATDKPGARFEDYSGDEKTLPEMESEPVVKPEPKLKATPPKPKVQNDVKSKPINRKTPKKPK